MRYRREFGTIAGGQARSHLSPEIYLSVVHIKGLRDASPDELRIALSYPVRKRQQASSGIS
jgi:hypothetical protein